jgi:mRNA-degrading endonuclease toxin of MazEF toxin-antitoxin module
MAAVCPISARPAKYPGEVPIAAGHAGQTRDAVILCHQLRTIDLARITALEVASRVQYVTDGHVRSAVRTALAHHLGLDLAAAEDSAA